MSDLGFWDKLRMLWAQRNPRRDRNVLAEAIPGVKEINPIDIHYEGVPSYGIQFFIAFVGIGFGIIMFAITQACVAEDLVVSLDDLNLWNLIASLGAVAGGTSLIYVINDSHRGTFDRLEKQFQPWLRFSRTTGKMTSGCLRIVKSLDMWPYEGANTPDTRAVLEAVEQLVEEDQSALDILQDARAEEPTHDAIELLRELM